MRLAVISRLAWIRRKRAEFDGQDRQSWREFVTGESHYFEGRRYRLDVVVSGGPTGIRLRNTPEKLKPWLAKYRLGELWMRGEIGGTRW